LVRVWLPDRPGALAAVAARIGALKGDVLGLEIVERRNGLAIDELVVSIPDGVPVDLIANEVGQVDDAEVEDIRPLEDSTYDPQLDALEAAAIILGAGSREELGQALCEHVGRTVRANWACVLESDGTVFGSWGDRPNDRWLDSFVSGSPPCDTPARMPEMDTVWLPLPVASAALIVGRDTAIRARERHRIAALARIADAWFRRLKESANYEAWMFHPSRP
ncbi:MAG: hypothetical protein AAGA93_28725, partial [Actinomycetota bacterium]